MRLIKASTIHQAPALEFKTFNPDSIPPYAILSHTWTHDEVIWADFTNGRNPCAKASFGKVKHICLQALKDQIEWVWVDSCCIDKSSSAELSEAINSMFLWYETADVCYAHLSGVSSTVDINATDGEFSQCKWFTRGWTLQEMLAAPELIFYSEDWIPIGHKVSLSRTLSVITGVDEDILTGKLPLQSASVAKRMSWAAHRKTTRPEDVAYCLMGIFDVNMPMLYGEGSKAFLRLQEEIMKSSDDQSLFAWTAEDASDDATYGLLARSPSNFARSRLIFPYQDWSIRSPYDMTNRGLRIQLPLTKVDGGSADYIAVLDCPSPPEYEQKTFLAIYLRKTSDLDHQYVRIKAGRCAKVHQRGELRTIYVRQDGSKGEDVEGVFPLHVLQLRGGPATSEYVVTKILFDDWGDRPKATSTDVGVVRRWVPQQMPIAFRTSKSPGQLTCALIFTRAADDERLVVMFGSAGLLRVGALAMELEPILPEHRQHGWERKTPSFSALRSQFRPVLEGHAIRLQYHMVNFEVHPVISNGVKYLMVDLHVEKVAESDRLVRLLDAVLESQSRVPPSMPNMERDSSKKKSFLGLRKRLGFSER